MNNYYIKLFKVCNRRSPLISIILCNGKICFLYKWMIRAQNFQFLSRMVNMDILNALSKFERKILSNKRVTEVGIFCFVKKARDVIVLNIMCCIGISYSLTLLFLLIIFFINILSQFILFVTR